VIQLDIRADVAGATASLKALDIEVKRMAQKLLRALATIAKKRIKKRMAGYLHTRTGELQKAVYGFSRSPSHAVVSAGQRWKAEALEKGATIVPRKRQYLAFLGDDGVHRRLPQVVIPPKRWFTGSLEGFEGDPDYQATIDKVLGKAIKKALG
jgi:hypothetical protein